MKELKFAKTLILDCERNAKSNGEFNSLVSKSYFEKLNFEQVKFELNKLGFDIINCQNTKEFEDMPNSFKESLYFVFKI